MSTPNPPIRRHQPTLRGEGAKVTPLELFFDLIFVLALTQCTALMAEDLSWLGITRGLLILAMLWWAWVGYSWLTSVVDPEEGEVRIAIFAAMAAMLVASLCVPEAFGELGLLFALSYGAVRIGQIVLFALASGDDPNLRRSVTGLAVSTTLGVTPLILASFTEGWLQTGLWALALVIDMGGPLLFGADGWKLSPEHFAERHGLIVIIALGESIVAIGVGAEAGVDAQIVIAAVGGMAVAACLWWAYFDVVALVSTHRLEQAAPGREQNTMARDAFSILHLPMVAGIVLLALGLKKTLGHTEDHLYLESSAALFGGVAAYFLALSAFRRRNIGRWNRSRLALGVGLLLLIPVGTQIAAIWSLLTLAGVLIAYTTYEVRTHGEGRAQIRAELRH